MKYDANQVSLIVGGQKVEGFVEGTFVETKPEPREFEIPMQGPVKCTVKTTLAYIDPDFKTALMGYKWHRKKRIRNKWKNKWLKAMKKCGFIVNEGDE